MVQRLTAMLCLLALFAFGAQAQRYTALVGGTVINPKKGDTIANSIVLIKDSAIVAVGSRIKGKIPESAEIIDVAGKYILPGYIDGHIHFFQSGGLYTRPDAIDLRHRIPYKEEIHNIKANLDDVFRRYICSGITSVVDMGGPMWNFEVKQKAAETPCSPRVYTTGPLLSSYQPQALASEDLPIIKINSIAEARAYIEKIAARNADFIKIWYVVSKSGSTPLMEFYPIVHAIIEESHRRGLRVFVHATELETARKAVEAGCDVLVHCITDKPVDDEFLRLCKTRKVIVVPTLWVFSSYDAVFAKQLKLMKVEHLLGNPATIGSLLDMYELNYEELGERQKRLLVEGKTVAANAIALRNLKLMQDYGITIAAGTDAGNIGVIHGPSIFHEFEFMKQAGLTPMEILASATSGGARLMEMEDVLGSVEPGKLADLVVLDTNPLSDISNASQISFVMKGGKVFYPDSVLALTPGDLAQIQLNAYNSRDLETFMSIYSDDVEMYRFPDSLIASGKKQMSDKYRDLFEKFPNLHCKLVNRIVKGRWVIDRESVSGFQGSKPSEAAAIYETTGKSIKKVWFLP